MEEPLPLPPYTFDGQLSDDQNYLVWTAILCRHSFSRKGHMGALLVDPRANAVVAFANNTPLLWSAVQKKAGEVHAEALAVGRAAASGAATAGATCYVTAPPCAACFQALAAAGVARIVHFGARRCDAVDVAARALGVAIEGVAFNNGSLDYDARARQFWLDQSETAEVTRARVDAWWVRWMDKYKKAARDIGVAVTDLPGNGHKKRRIKDVDQGDDQVDDEGKDEEN
ncbi:hypothetical protein BDR26DRAFT_931154 [Obelidium mucronatum]|nr:hypothetical protein BDR26DRAFT_931154 [Obelidium mucronatum]